MRRLLIAITLLALFSSSAYAQWKGPDQRAVIGGIANTGKMNTFRQANNFIGPIYESNTGPVTMSAGTLVLSGIYSTGGTMTATGEALIAANISFGLQLKGDGAIGDVTLINNLNNAAMRIPTGTTNVQAIGGLSIDFTNAGRIVESTTAPSISSGFCTSPTIGTAFNTMAFTINVGSSCGGTTTGVVTMPTASHGWACSINDLTTISTTNQLTKVTATTTTSVTVATYTDAAAAGAWTAADVLQFICAAY